LKNTEHLLTSTTDGNHQHNVPQISNASWLNSLSNASFINLSLAGLQQFAAGLVNDVVRAGDHDVRLGNIVYFITNEKGRAEPTGLSWERATLTAGFENIVVSTADHIFNDTEIRQDEDMTYYR